MQDQPSNCNDEDTSSLEEDFVPENVTNDIGHKLSSQESASMAFDILGLKRKADLQDGEYA